MLFGDVEALVVAHLDTAVSGARVVTELPYDLVAHLPVLRVTGTGGSDDKITDTATVDVESFAVLRADSVDLAESVRRAMHALAHTAVVTPGGTVQVDTVETLTRPMWIDYQNDQIHRFTATYEVATRGRAR